MAIADNPKSTLTFQRKPVRSKQGTNWLGTLFLMAFFLYFLLPLFWLVVSSTKTNAELFSTFGLWFPPDFNLVDNVKILFTQDDGIFINWLWNTLYYATCSALGAAFFAALAGYTFSKYHFPGRRLLFALILGAVMVPGTATVIPIYLLLSNASLINTPLAVILPSMVSPFGVFLMRIYADQAIPDELLDAARVDGSGELRIFWSVVLRLLVPGFVTVLLFSFVAIWNNYFLPLLVLNDTHLFPVIVGLANWNARAAAGSGVALLYTQVIVGSLISITPLIIAFLFLQRYWQSGLTVGSVKS